MYVNLHSGNLQQKCCMSHIYNLNFLVVNKIGKINSNYVSYLAQYITY